MRLSPQKNTLAVLRVLIGLTQKELAALVDVSPKTVQAVELNKLPLSDSLAARIADQTHVEFFWLIRNKVDEPPITSQGEPYTRGFFEEVRGELTQKAPPSPEREFQHFYNLQQWHIGSQAIILGTLLSAFKSNQMNRAFYRLDRMLLDFRCEFGTIDEADEAARMVDSHEFWRGDLEKNLAEYREKLALMIRGALEDSKQRLIRAGAFPPKAQSKTKRKPRKSKPVR